MLDSTLHSLIENIRSILTDPLLLSVLLLLQVTTETELTNPPIIHVSHTWKGFQDKRLLTHRISPQLLRDVFVNDHLQETIMYTAYLGSGEGTREVELDK